MTTRPWSDRDCQHDRLVAYGGNNTAGPIDVATACNAHGGAHGRLDFESETFVAHTLRADGFDASEDGTGRGTPLVPVAFAELGEGHATYRETDTITGLRTDAGGGSKMANLIAFNATGVKPSPGETTPTLRGGSHANAGHVAAVAYQCHGTNVGPMGTLKEGDGNVTSGVPFVVNAAESCAKRDHARPSDVARCLDGTGGFASSQGGTVVTQPYNIVGLAQQGRNHAYPAEISGCLQGKGLAATGNEAGTLVQSSMAVRRLTPRECERLQGFPDDWTFIPVKPIRKPTPRVLAKWRALGRLGLLDGEPWIMSADGPRYKAIGNSMAVPVMAWIGRRIEMVRSLVATADAGEGGR